MMKNWKTILAVALCLVFLAADCVLIGMTIMRNRDKAAYERRVNMLEWECEFLRKRDESTTEVDLRGLTFMGVEVFRGFDCIKGADYFRVVDINGKEVKILYDDNSVILRALMDARWEAKIIHVYDDGVLDNWYRARGVARQLGIIEEVLLGD